MFDLNPRTTVSTYDATITGTVYGKHLLISSIKDTDEGLTMRFKEIVNPELGDFDMEVPISLTLSQNGDLHYHSVEADIEGVVNIKDDPQGWSNVVLDQFNEVMMHAHINANLHKFSEMTSAESQEALLEFLFSIYRPSPRARTSLMAAFNASR